LKEEALDRSQWKSRFGRGYGPVIKQTTEWILFGPSVSGQTACASLQTNSTSQNKSSSKTPNIDVNLNIYRQIIANKRQIK
jgi:hypothetical protein